MLSDQVKQVFADVDTFVLKLTHVICQMFKIRRELVHAACFLGCAPSDPTQTNSILVGDLEEIALLTGKIFIDTLQFKVRFQYIYHIIILLTLLRDPR